jgi:hypothetical protein
MGMSKRTNKRLKTAAVLGMIVVGCGAAFHTSDSAAAESAGKQTSLFSVKADKPKQGSVQLSKHLKDIRFCESTDNYKAVNKQSPSHTGAFQFADSTWAAYKTGYKHAKDAPASVQDAIAVKEFAKNGNSPWLASKPCWSKR